MRYKINVTGTVNPGSKCAYGKSENHKSSIDTKTDKKRLQKMYGESLMK